MARIRRKWARVNRGQHPFVAQGYGRCSVSGCPCPNFRTTYDSNDCSNCGHNYTDHW
jgi:hypothetical protein